MESAENFIIRNETSSLVDAATELRQRDAEVWCAAIEEAAKAIENSSQHDWRRPRADIIRDLKRKPALVGR